jgi:uncharacterized membrane protein
MVLRKELYHYLRHNPSAIRQRVRAMPTASRRPLIAAAAVAVVWANAPAHADLNLCNRMSYVVEAAIGLEDKAATATRGWFRLDPGQCRAVLQGAIQAENVYLHARAHAVYGPSPLPQSGHADLCVAQQGDFVVAAARQCRAGQRPARFSLVKPSEGEKGATVNLAEEGQYTDDQARDAGIQRLLTLIGYDSTPIDGIRGTKTDASLSQFIKDNKLAVTAAARSDFFDTLLAAAQRTDSGFSWCNESGHTVMAAIGIEDQGAITTRGWYRLEPGRCLRPDVSGQPKKLYSFAEAVDAEGQPVRRGDRPVVWGGDMILCTRNVKFEFTEQGNCAAKGLTGSGFAPIDLSDRSAMTLRLK